MDVSAHRNCCGISHISNMGTDPQARHAPDNITYLQKLDLLLAGRDRRRTYEIVLNGRQNDVWGQLIIDRGGQLVAQAVNQLHESRIFTYYFNDDLLLYGTREQPAQQVAVPLGEPDAEGNYPNYAPLSRVPRGTRVQCNNRQSQYHLRVGSIVGTPRNAEATAYTVRYDQGGESQLSIEYFRPERRVAAPARPAFVWTHVYVHPNGAGQYHGRLVVIDRVNGANASVHVQGRPSEHGQAEVVTHARLRPLRDVMPPAPVIAPPAPARQERRPVLTEYAANLRVGGRRGPFPALLEAREAYPRCRNFERRIVFSDGTVEWNGVE